jgi:hypothetical protein
MLRGDRDGWCLVATYVCMYVCDVEVMLRMDTHLGNDFSKLNCSESSLQSDERVYSSSYDQVKASDEFVLCGGLPLQPTKS